MFQLDLYSWCHKAEIKVSAGWSSPGDSHTGRSIFNCLRLWQNSFACGCVPGPQCLASYQLEIALGNERLLSGPGCVAFSTDPLNTATYVFSASYRISFMLQILTLGWAPVPFKGLPNQVRSIPDNLPFEQSKVSCFGILITPVESPQLCQIT